MPHALYASGALVSCSQRCPTHASLRRCQERRRQQQHAYTPRGPARTPLHPPRSIGAKVDERLRASAHRSQASAPSSRAGGRRLHKSTCTRGEPAPSRKRCKARRKLRSRSVIRKKIQVGRTSIGQWYPATRFLLRARRRARRCLWPCVCLIISRSRRRQRLWRAAARAPGRLRLSRHPAPSPYVRSPCPTSVHSRRDKSRRLSRR